MPTIEKRISQSAGKKITSYRARVRVKGHREQSATFERKTDAERWAYEAESKLKNATYFPNDEAKNRTVSELIDRYLQHLKASNIRRYNEALPLLEWWKDEHGSKRLNAFTAEDVLSAQHALMMQPKKRKRADDTASTLSPATVNRYLTALHTAIKFGVSPLKWLLANPVDEVGKLKESQGRRRFLSKQEIKALLGACKRSKNTYLFTIILVAIATGACRSEISNMRWEDVSQNCEMITLPKTKNGEVRSLGLSGAARETVQKLKSSNKGSSLLFPSPKNPNKPIDFESAWRKALQQANIKDFRFHDLRHTCASYLAMNGASLIEIADALGHKTLEMVKRYAHLSPDHTKQVVAQMNSKVLGDVEV